MNKTYLKANPNHMKTQTDPNEGRILIYVGTADVIWSDPVYSDNELREKYSELEVSWQRVLEAISEYELIKKLVDDYD